jgi:hypothetical protein
MCLSLLRIILALFSSLAFSFELVVIQGVSKSNQTFITRQGKENSILLGKKATFTAENVTIIAKAVNVTREFTQWQVENPIVDVPFEKDQIVTYYDATEYLWTLTPEEQKKKYIKRFNQETRNSIELHAAFSRGLNQSVSGVDAQEVERGGMLYEVYFEKELSHHIALDIGFRYEKEIVNTPEASLHNTRALLLGDIRYYFDASPKIYEGRVFVGLGFGHGQSSTEYIGATSSGTINLIPAAKFGLALPFSDKYEMLVSSAFEYLAATEKLESGEEVVTNSSNLKLALGLKYFF